MTSRIVRHITFPVVLILACCAVAFAQDSGQVLRVSVSYGTMKNTPSIMSRLSPEARAEVDKLGEMARSANGEGKYGEALKHLYHAMSVMRGVAWTPARALASAISVKLEKAMLDPGDKLVIKVGQIYALDEKVSTKLTGSISLLKLRGDDVIKELKVLESVDPDFVANPLSAEVLVPDVEPGNYRIAVRVQVPGNEPILKNTTVHIERGLAADYSAAKARAAKIQDSLKAKRQDGLLAALPSAQYRISLFELARAGELNFDRLDFRETLKEANTMLDALEAGSDPFSTRRGEFKKAYLSKVDNTLQPYQVYVPTSYEKSKRFPLIIALHGMGGDENSYFQAYAQGAFKTEAEKHGYIVACPKGRKPASMYLGDADKDVMDVLAEMRRDYNVDPDRIYLTGHSMGGYGTWSLAMSHPDVFAALAPISGGSNTPVGMSKIAHIPQLVVHGDTDPTVPVERSRVMVAAGKKLGAEIKYIEVPGGDHGSVVAPNFPAVFEWFDTHKRKTGAAAGAAAGASKNN
jgi:predicted esterase